MLSKGYLSRKCVFVSQKVAHPPSDWCTPYSGIDGVCVNWSLFGIIIPGFVRLYVQIIHELVDKHGMTILYRIHQCRHCILAHNDTVCVGGIIYIIGWTGAGARVVILFPCATQLSITFQLLIKTKIVKNKDTSLLNTLRLCIHPANKC